MVMVVMMMVRTRRGSGCEEILRAVVVVVERVKHGCVTPAHLLPRAARCARTRG